RIADRKIIEAKSRNGLRTITVKIHRASGNGVRICSGRKRTEDFYSLATRQGASARTAAGQIAIGLSEGGDRLRAGPVILDRARRSECVSTVVGWEAVRAADLEQRAVADRGLAAGGGSVAGKPYQIKSAGSNAEIAGN